MMKGGFVAGKLSCHNYTNPPAQFVGSVLSASSSASWEEDEEDEERTQQVNWGCPRHSPFVEAAAC